MARARAGRWLWGSSCQLRTQLDSCLAVGSSWITLIGSSHLWFCLFELL